jgi:isopentenyl-diphosphate delta-isomerase
MLALARSVARAARPLARPDRALLSTNAGVDFSQYDEAQLAMMEEQCIVVDRDDNIVGEDSKKNVHLIDGPCMRPGGLPHRAFSVFLFDEDWNLLLQKRCDDKILFPLHWANTCCSHPLADGATFLGSVVRGEQKGPPGTVQAARRKLEQELGLAPEALPAECFQFVTKVHYKAPLPGKDPQWGEHEIDYILLAQRPRAAIEASLALNPNEVCDARWVSQEECLAFVAGAGNPHGATEAERAGEWISPWFGAIHDELLHPWWDALRAGRTVEADGAIHRLEGADEA